MSETSQENRRNIATAILDYFVHASLRTDSDKINRARILVATMLTFPIVSLTAYIIVVAAGFSKSSMLYGAMICLPTAAFFMLLLYVIRREGHYMFCSVFSVLMLMGVVVAGVCVSGGPVVSPALQILVVPPLTAYFFGGTRWGGYAVGLTFATLLTLVGLHFMGVEFLQTVTPANMDGVHFLVSLVNLSAISAMAFIYEFTAAVLRRERDAEHEKYIHLAKTDALTGLANRRNFDAMLLERMQMYALQEPVRRFALGYLDLDGFKPINDTYGHAVGDEVLRAVSDRMRGVLRGSDFVGRHGGDEFMLMLDMVGEPPVLDMMAQRLLKVIAQPIQSTAGPVQVSGSLGFAIYPLDSSDVEELKKAADTAMYAAKRTKGCWRQYTPELANEPAPERPPSSR